MIYIKEEIAKLRKFAKEEYDWVLESSDKELGYFIKIFNLDKHNKGKEIDYIIEELYGEYPCVPFTLSEKRIINLQIYGIDPDTKDDENFEIYVSDPDIEYPTNPLFIGKPDEVIKYIKAILPFYKETK